MNDSPLVTWLFGLQRFGVVPGLNRVRALLAALDMSAPAFDVVLVGGTNGKGSTSATLAAMLTASGRRTGLFTSPHLTRFTERLQVDGREVSPEEVERGLAELRPVAESVGATFFEVVTALAVLVFSRRGVEASVFEVGLGGRFDATNALEPVLSVVTNVGLDHTEVLGSTIEAIAREKRGILRPGKRAVVGVLGTALDLIDEVGADVWALGREAEDRVEPLGWNGNAVRLQDPLGAVAFVTPLLGAHGARNAALAALAARRLGLNDESIREGTRATLWPGRLEPVRWRGATVLLDGAHNLEGAAALVAALRELGVGRVPLVFGGSADKDLAGIARVLEAVASEVIVTRARWSPRAADPAELAALFTVPVTAAASPADVLDMLPPGLSVVAGSLYLVGEIRPLLLGEVSEKRERWQ